MTAWRSALALCVACVLLGPPAYGADGSVPGRRLFTFADDDVFESSGLLDRGDVVYTTNDSGDDAVVYGVDPATGRTVSRTRYADSVDDVEALAPGAGGTVWAADIGDNRHDREGVTVYRMRPRDGDHQGRRYTLTYPDGPHDAETLLVHPRTRRMFVVSKSPFGGTVYVAPRTLAEGPPNRLRAFARVDGLVTDSSFFPDGRHVVLRTYGRASVYAFPAFELLGTVRLPAQPQGEGVAVAPEGRVTLSTEGVHTDVLEVTLPASLTARTGPAGKPEAAPSGRPSDAAAPARDPRDARDWAGIALVAAVIAGFGYLSVRGSRVRGPR